MRSNEYSVGIIIIKQIKMYLLLWTPIGFDPSKQLRIPVTSSSSLNQCAISPVAAVRSLSNCDLLLGKRTCHPFALSHFNIFKCPPLAALAHTLSYQGYCANPTHCRTINFPASAAPALTDSSQVQPLSVAHSNTSSWPLHAA